ncbi:hypothetical protein SAY87_009345 [Trapa incisa]|uniref:Uncharacterized protein n=1 Tax=Trapa incisa TaxID=236973 RepID=A0AAN7K1I8_9MYRT|nr:hypothetical protein SAY87_009345 [Trapa incisa]
MAEQEKKNTSVEPKLKKDLLDEDIGKEFLSSWKSMSMTEYDGIDFSFGASGKIKKNAFNFDKLDMDFNLDGDFNKLSSFKVDMPEIDFSCSPKKSAKPKDGNADELEKRNGRCKKETLSFSFDFNEMEDFNFDSSLTKGEKPPEKDSVTREIASGKVDDQDTKVHMSKDFTSCDEVEMITATKTLEASEIHNSETGPSVFVSMKTNLLEPANFRDKALENEEGDCLGMEMSEDPQESDQPGCLIIQSAQTGKHAHDEDVRDLEGNSKVLREVCSSGTTMDANIGREQTICNDMVGEDLSYSKSLHLVHQQASHTTKSLIDASHMDLLGIGTLRDSMDCSEQGQNQLDTEDARTVNNLKQTQSKAKFDRWDTTLVKVDLNTLNRDAAGNQISSIKSKESGHVCSKFFKTLANNVNQLNKEPRLVQIGSKRVSGINTTPAEEKIISTCRDGGQKSKAVNDSDAIPRDHTKDTIVAEASKIVNDTSRTMSLSSLNSKGISKTLGVQSFVAAEHTGSSTEALGNSRIVRLSDNKLCSINARAARNMSNFSILRDPGSAVKQLSSRTLAGVPMTKDSEQSTGIKEDYGKVTLHPGDSSEKEKKLMQTTLKRKSYETSNASAVSCSPLKRLSELPVESRSFKESAHNLLISSRHIREACCEKSEDVKSRNVLAEASPSQVEVSTLKNIVDYKITASVDNDENLGKADAYAKELEDLCSMLKKKQDEAKELLVRAIVNNNHLLMLNHPIFERKISF